MNSLLLYAGENANIDPATFRMMLDKIPGTEELDEPSSIPGGPRYIYRWNADSTYVKLLSQNAISLGREGDASLSMALALQHALPMPLILFDAGYSFEVRLLGIESIEDLRAKIR